jgi:hypothetical protein
MKTPVEYVLIFSQAPTAHFKIPHCGGGTIVGQTFHNGETRAAVSTIYEWVINSVRIIRHIGKTVIAYGNIRTYFRDLIINYLAAGNAEIVISVNLLGNKLYGFYLGCRRCIFQYFIAESFDRLQVTL